MTAKEYFETQSLTDATKNVVDVFRQKFSKLDLIKFAESYHAHETKQPKKELLSIGSYEQEQNKIDEFNNKISEHLTNLKNY